jgi:hypothetical protein
MTRSMTATIHAAARRVRRLLRPWQVRLRRIERRLSYRILAALDRRSLPSRLGGELTPAPVPVRTSTR